MMTWKEYIDEANEILDESPLNEKMAKKKMVKDGQRITKWVTNKPGYRIEYDENDMPHEVRISNPEKKKRELGQKKAKIQRASKMKNLQKKRLKSFKKRDSIGLKYNKELPDIVTKREEGSGKIPSDIKGWLKQKLDNMKNKLNMNLTT